MADYELKIDFATDSPNPSRVFRSMTGLIESFDRFDRDFLGSLDLYVDSQLVLHDVERGSLKATLRRILNVPDQQALREGDWKKMVGRMIDDGRQFLLRKLEEKPKVTSREHLLEIQTGLVKIVSTAPLSLIHVPNPIPLARLLATIESFESSVTVLASDDSVTYRSEYTEQRVTKEISVDPAVEEELLEAVPVQLPTRVQLPVKKPDLIGDSQWDLYLGGHVIRAKILDTDWLSKFHNRSIALRPGDALDALLEITLLKTPTGDVVGYRYQVSQVFGVMPRTESEQLMFPEG